MKPLAVGIITNSWAGAGDPSFLCDPAEAHPFSVLSLPSGRCQDWAPWSLTLMAVLIPPALSSEWAKQSATQAKPLLCAAPHCGERGEEGANCSPASEDFRKGGDWEHRAGAGCVARSPAKLGTQSTPGICSSFHTSFTRSRSHFATTLPAPRASRLWLLCLLQLFFPLLCLHLLPRATTDIVPQACKIQVKANRVTSPAPWGQECS